MPAAGDTVTFNATSTNNSTVDAGFNATETIVTININAGYTGTITLGTTLHVTTSFVQAAGTFTAGNQTLDMNGSFTLSAGSFTASSGSTTLAGAMTISGAPTFNHNSGTFTVDGTANATLSCNNVAFNLVSFTHTAGIKTVSSNCSLPLGADPTFGVIGSITLNGTLSGSGTLTIGDNPGFTFLINAGYSLSGFDGISVRSLNIKGATANFGSYTTFIVSQAFTLASGAIFTAPSGTMSVGGTPNFGAGTTFNHNNGTLNLNGSTSVTMTCNNAVFNLVTFTHTAGTKTVSSDCSLPLGANPTVGSGSNPDIILNGTFSGSGNLTIGTQGSSNLLTLNTGYSLSGFSGYLFGGLTISGATANFGSIDPVDIRGAFTLSSGAVFTAPATTMSVANNFTLNAGTIFNANGGTVDFDGSTATLACNNTAFNLVTFNNTSTKTIGSDCSLPLGADPTIAAGITLNGTLSGSGTLNSAPAATTTFNAGATLTGFTGLIIRTFNVSGATLNLGSYTTLDVNGVFTLSSGTFTAPSGTATFAAGFTASGGTFNANGGTITIDGSSSSTLACGGVTFNLVTFMHTAGTKTVNSDCNLPLGNNPLVGNSGTSGITLNGTLTGTGTLTTTGTGITTINSTGVLSGFDGLVTGGQFISNGATTNFGSYTIVDINNTFTLNSGAVFTAPSSTMYASANFYINPGTTFNANGGTLVFDTYDLNPITDRTIACDNTVFNLVAFTHTNHTKIVSSDCSLPLGNNPTAGAGGSITNNGTLSGTGTLTTTGTLTLNTGYALSGFTGLNSKDLVIDAATANFGSYNTLDVDNDFTLQNNATFTATSANMMVGGNFSVLDTSTFNHNNGTVILDGGDQSVVGTTFYNLTKICATDCTLTMPAGSTEIILGTLTLKGAEGQLLSIVSSIPGSPWYIDAQGGRNLAYLAVSDSVNINDTAMQACNSVDGGGNSNWVFNGIVCVGSGTSTSEALANTGNNANAIYMIAVMLILIGLFGLSMGVRKSRKKTN